MKGTGVFMFKRRKRRFQNDTAFLLAGAAVGGAIALLYAPKPGSELRKDIKNEVDKSLLQVKQGTVSLKNRAGNILDLSRQYLGSSYESTSNSIFHEIASLRTAFNSAVEAYKNYKEQPVEHQRQPRTNNVFTSTDVQVNDEDLPKFEGMGRRQE